MQVHGHEYIASLSFRFINVICSHLKIVLISRLHSTLAYQYLLVGHDLSDALLFFLAPTHPQVTVSAPYHQ